MHVWHRIQACVDERERKKERCNNRLFSTGKDAWRLTMTVINYFHDKNESGMTYVRTYVRASTQENKEDSRCKILG